MSRKRTARADMSVCAPSLCCLFSNTYQLTGPTLSNSRTNSWLSDMWFICFGAARHAFTMTCWSFLRFDTWVSDTQPSHCPPISAPQKRFSSQGYILSEKFPTLLVGNLSFHQHIARPIGCYSIARPIAWLLGVSLNSSLLTHLS